MMRQDEELFVPVLMLQQETIFLHQQDVPDCGLHTS